MSHCSACNHPLRPEAKFCTACGQRVAAAAPADLSDAAAAQGSTALHVASAGSPEVALTAPAERVEIAGPDAVAPPGGLHAATPPATPVTGTAPEAAPATDLPRYPEPGTVTGASRQFDAAAFTAAAANARTQVGQSVQRIPLPQQQVTTALTNGALLAVGSFAVCVAVLFVIDLLSEGNAAPMMWARGAAIILALTLRGSLAIGTEDGDLGGVFGFLPGNAESALERIDGAAHLVFMPLGLTAILLGAVYLVARRSEKTSPSGSTRDRAIRAALTGVAFAVVAALLAAVLKFAEQGVSLGAGIMSTFLGAFCLVALSTFIGHGAHASAVARLPHAWQNDIRTGAELVLGSILAAALVVVAALVYALATEDTRGEFALYYLRNLDVLDQARGALGTVLAVVLFVPNLLVSLAGLILGTSGTAALDTSGAIADDYEGWSQSVGLLDGVLPGQYLLVMLVLCLLTATVVGIRAVLRHDPTRPMRVWQPALAAAAIWLVLGWLTTIRISASGSLRETDGFTHGGAAASIGLNALGVCLAAALWTAVAVVIGTYAARALGRSAPSALSRLAGRRTDRTWDVAVTDAMLRRGQVPPARLAPIADGLRTGTVPQPHGLLF